VKEYSSIKNEAKDLALARSGATFAEAQATSINKIRKEEEGENDGSVTTAGNEEEGKEIEAKEDISDKKSTSMAYDGDRQRPKWWDSSKSVVIALAAGYGLNVYQQFVGTLRATGYKGYIILGISKHPPPDVKRYLHDMNVIMKEVPLAENCTYKGYLMESGEPSTNKKCPAAYPDYKFSWARFPLARDWLVECDDCTGGVMLTDSRDAYFQSDPFTYPFGDKPIDYLPGELMVFEETPELTTDHWIASIPVEKCRKYELKGRPMLCSGSTMGTRQGILDHINSMVEEFDYWKEHQECRSDMAGDDQSIHNHLYYNSQLKNAVSIPHRTGPIHIVGVQADKIFRTSIRKAMEEGYGKDLHKAEDFVNRFGYMHWNESRTDERSTGGRRKDWRTWLPPEHNLIDPKTGFITNLNGKPSPQVHQFDRFGLMVDAYKLVRQTEDAAN